VVNKLAGCIVFLGFAAFFIAAGWFAYGAHSRTQFVMALGALVITPVTLVLWAVVAIMRRAAKKAVLARPAAPAAAPAVSRGICGVCFRQPAQFVCGVHGMRFCRHCIEHHDTPTLCTYCDVTGPVADQVLYMSLRDWKAQGYAQSR